MITSIQIPQTEYEFRTARLLEHLHAETLSGVFYLTATTSYTTPALLLFLPKAQ
jgi:hypothetical protein